MNILDFTWIEFIIYLLMLAAFARLGFEIGKHDKKSN